MYFHVVFPGHFELLFILWITTFYNKFIWKDISQFSTITISASYDSFFIIIVVATSKKMSKDELRNVDFMFFMNDNGDSFTIIEHRYWTSFRVNIYFELWHFLVSLIIVSCIDQNLIKYLVESRCKGDLSMGESNLVFRKNPFCLFGGFNCTDISVRSKQNVLQRSFLLINLLNRLLFLHDGNLYFECSKFIYWLNFIKFLVSLHLVKMYNFKFIKSFNVFNIISQIKFS